MQTTAHPQPVAGRHRRRRPASGQPRQIDLFGDPSPTEIPAWRDLPEAARGHLTNLMTQLILDHMRSGSLASTTEAGHDL